MVILLRLYKSKCCNHKNAPPRLDDALDDLSGSDWFYKIDLQHGYLQVELPREDCEKNTSTTGRGLYHF